MELDKRKAEIEEMFGKLAKKKDELRNQMAQIEVEQMRLQGEFRLIEELSKKKEPTKKIPKKK